MGLFVPQTRAETNRVLNVLVTPHPHFVGHRICTLFMRTRLCSLRQCCFVDQRFSHQPPLNDIITVDICWLFGRTRQDEETRISML